MKINAGFYAGSPNQVSAYVLEGKIKVDGVAPVIDSLTFSVQNLLQTYSLDKDCGINIDFKKWLDVLQKEQNLLIYYKAFKMLKNFADFEFSLDDDYSLTAGFTKKKTKDEHIKHVEDVVSTFFYDDANQVIKSRMEDSFSTKWFFNPSERNIVYLNDDIVITLSKKATKEIFELISEHVNKEIDNALSETENKLSRIQGLDVLCQDVDQTRKFLMTITDALFDVEEEQSESYDKNRIADILENELKFTSVFVY